MAEAEIMDELHGLNGELKSFPPDAHWFCPRRRDDDFVDYDNPNEAEEDISPGKKQELIQNYKRRFKIAYKLSLILGLSVEVSGPLLDEYTQGLGRFLTGCDKCVYNWHMGRKTYLKELAEHFDDDAVEELSNRINKLDFQRLNQGLQAGCQLLAAAQPQNQSQNLLARGNAVALMALYEALCCVDYHKSDKNLSKFFDYVFEHVQTKKPLKIKDILPAMARFLFDNNQYRLRFALSAWEKVTSLTKESFDWVVHDVLSERIALVSHATASHADIQRFWEGFTQILEKMNEDLITHSLRGMEVQPNIYLLALQHLACDSDEITYLVIKVLRTLLRKSPKSFWDAFATISPTVITEEIFKRSAFERLLSRPQALNSVQESSVTAWIPEFIKSLHSVHQSDACRSILHHLLERLQDLRISEKVRLISCRAGLDALHCTLETFVKQSYEINPSTSLIVINDVMGLVLKYIQPIVGCADLANGDQIHLELKRLAMLVIRDALALDCKVLRAEYEALAKDIAVQRGLRTHSQSIWQQVLDIFRPGNLDLAKSILAAAIHLTGLDELRPKDKRRPQMPQDHVKFNDDFHLLNENIARVFERLSDFNASDLRQMYEDPQTARPLFAALVSSDQGTYEASVEVIKAMTGHTGKQDAIQSLLEEALAPMLNSLTYAVVRITKARIFSPIPYLIKIGRETLEALCGNTGILRSRTALSTADQTSIMSWWHNQWRAIDVVFSLTEAWATRVNRSTKYMMEFLRDAMEYAESLIDNYKIIASALSESGSPSEDPSYAQLGPAKASRKKVLEVVCQYVNGLTMMLRLRDEYLVSVITSLLVKLLRCLSEFDIDIAEKTSRYIKNACRSERDHHVTRTNLTNQQKAELQKALDEHEGVEIIESPLSAPPRKQSMIDAWSQLGGNQMTIQSRVRSGPSSSSISNPSNRAQTVLEQVKASQSAAQTQLFRERRRKAEDEKKQRNAEAAARAKEFLGQSTLVRGEGSGLKSIGGVEGKDHAPIRSEIMVGSSDEASSGDDEDEMDAIVTMGKKASQNFTDYEERKKRARKLEPQGPTRIAKIQRTAKDLLARVEPNMDVLYEAILNWEFFHDGDTPPSKLDYVKIADKFFDPGTYRNTFEPLIISEIWRSLVTAKEENNFKAIEINVVNRLSVDKFMEISTTMPMTLNRDLSMSERDIVLLSRSPNPVNSPQEPHCLARVDRTTRKKDVIEVTFRVSRDISPAFLQCLVPKGKIQAVKIADMTTTQREYASLRGLQYYDLCNQILQGLPSRIQPPVESNISKISSLYTLNRGQALAIDSVTINDGFTLIQGPPGSGKTKTIVAMVGSLLTETLKDQVKHVQARPQSHNPSSANAPLKKKLLICAPSNAAVDELVVRLKDGVQPFDGPRQKINVIRIGRSDAINASVKDVILDELVRKRLEGDKDEKKGQLSKREQLHKRAGDIKEQLNELRPQMDQARDDSNKELELRLQRKFDELKRAQARVGAQIEEDKSDDNTRGRENEINRRRFQQEIIDEAHVLCATLSGSGHDMFRNLNVEFETVIIDEAAQCIELSALIPLKYGCRKCVLVGDPEQLPPTVLSRSAQSFGYEQSIFVRMQKNHPQDVHLLDTQYRMHPEISQFPSKEFYNSRLIDGNGMAMLRKQPWHASSILGPYRFFDVEGVQTKESKGHSFINIPELNAAMQLYLRLKTDYKSIDFKGKIGIITTYKAQLNELRNRFARKYGEGIFEEIEFNTTDAFQGREREIIIFSCVRATKGSIGFLADIRRMNVGLTRAKSSLWVLGDSRSLQHGQYWNRLIEDAKTRNRYTGGDVMSILSRPTSRYRNPAPESPLIEQPHTNSASHSRLSSNSEMKTFPSRIKAGEDSDVEMIDAPSGQISGKPSYGGSSTMPTEPKQNDYHTREQKIKEEPRESSVGGDDHRDFNQYGKRSRQDSINGGEIPIKKERINHPQTLKDNHTVPDLEAALQAQEAAKRTHSPRPQLPSGVAPPRKKAPADPFIQRRKPFFPPLFARFLSSAHAVIYTMRTSLESSTRRLVNPRSHSSDSVKIKQEMNVVSSAANEKNIRPTQITTPTPISDQGRAASSPVDPLSNPVQWPSASKMPIRSNNTQSPLRQVKSSHELDSRDNSRESLKTLAEFLRTKDPPPENWMSIPEDDYRGLRSAKKLSLNPFRRQASHKTQSPLLIQLPDTAVAARTTKGYRHIAISIPIEHDHLEYTSSSQQPVHAPAIPAVSKPNERPSRGTVTVLKPVSEAREHVSISSQLASPRGRSVMESARHSRAETPASELLGPETTKTLENYYNQLYRQQNRKSSQSTSSAKAEPSAETVNEAILAIQGMDLTPRKLSPSEIPREVEAELQAASQVAEDIAQDLQRSSFSMPRSPKPYPDSPHSRTPSSPPNMYETATTETYQSYHAAGIVGLRGTPKPPPNRKLPNLPERSSITIERPSTAPLSSPPQNPASRKRNSLPKSRADVQDIPQTRQEQVKARKQRDIAAICMKMEPKSPSLIPESPIINPSYIPTTPTTPTPARQNSKRKSASSEVRRRSTAKNCMTTNIMVVADLSPFFSLSNPSSSSHPTELPPTPPATAPLPGIRKSLSSASQSSRRSLHREETPLRPLQSQASDSDTIPMSGVQSPPLSLRNSIGDRGLEARRAERRNKRNMTIREREVDERMSRIERDNRVLMETLSGIASSFGELHRLIPTREQGQIQGLRLGLTPPLSISLIHTLQLKLLPCPNHIRIDFELKLEVRRRRRVEDARSQKLNQVSTIEENETRDVETEFPNHHPVEYAESVSKRQRSSISLVDRTLGTGHRGEGTKTFDPAFSRQMLLRSSPSPLLTNLTINFDPFESMTDLSPLLSSRYANELNVIKSHAIDFCFPGNTKSVVFPEALRTPALLASILYMAYANLSTLRDQSIPELALALKTTAISHVNKQLSHPITATCTSVIASVAYLSTGTWMFGDEPQETAAHLNGLQMMVQKRGMKSLVMQAMSAQPSNDSFHFDYDIGNGTLGSTTSLPETNPRYMCNVFMVPYSYKDPNEELLSILVSTRDLIDLVIDHHEDREPTEEEEAEFTVQLLKMKWQIHSHRSAHDPTSQSYNDFTYESCRLSCLLVAEAVEACKPLNQTSHLLACSLSAAIVRTNLSNTWGNMLGVLYWVSMIGSAAWKGRGGSRERKMDSTLGSTMFKETFENPDLGCAIRPARLFGRLQIALKRRHELYAY
ncbi:hypothetical protein B7494_g2735 [Chlorociboria aeruginascens]|nr:hypothetical protein B7494_g2735 [Chlorociboria aeruginascens]